MKNKKNIQWRISIINRKKKERKRMSKKERKKIINNKTKGIIKKNYLKKDIKKI